MPYVTPPLYYTGTTTNNTQAIAQADSTGLSDDKVSPEVRTARLQTYLSRVIDQNKKASVTTSVDVLDLSKNQYIKQYDIDTPQFAASVNKLPIARLVLNDLRSGKLKYNQVLSWTSSDVRAGAGVYDQSGAPTQATVKQLLFDMLNPSGNTAVRVLVNQGMGGADAVNKRFGSELGLTVTRLQPQGGNTFYVGNTTAREAIQNIQGLLATNDTYGKYVKNALATNIYTDYGVRSQLAGNDYIVLANKVGILDDPDGNNRHDVGIIYNQNTGKSYAYVFLNTAPGANYSNPTAQAGISLSDMGRGLLRYAGDKPQTTTEKAFGTQAPYTEKRTLY